MYLPSYLPLIALISYFRSLVCGHVSGPPRAWSCYQPEAAFHLHPAPTIQASLVRGLRERLSPMEAGRAVAGPLKGGRQRGRQEPLGLRPSNLDNLYNPRP